MIKYALFSAAVVLILSLPYPTYAKNGVIISIIDGDTLVVKMDNKIERIRILGIDTPELHTAKTGVAQCYAREARIELEKIAIKKILVDIQSDSLTKNRDIYGRYLRHVNIKGISIAEHLVKNGFAKVYTRSPASNTKKLIALQSDAKKSKKGLWKWCK